MTPSRRKLPPLNALRAFEVSGRRLSFRAAAEELGVTQGAVAQQVRAGRAPGPSPLPAFAPRPLPDATGLGLPDGRAPCL